MSDTKSFMEKYIIAMRATGLVAPILITIAILSIYLGYLYPPGFLQTELPDYAGLKALLGGTVLGLLGWLCVILVIKHSVTIDRANPAVYRELYSRFKIVEDQVDYLTRQLDKKYQESQEQGALAQHDETFANLGILSAKQEVHAYLKRLQEVLDEEVLDDEKSEQKNHGVPPQLAPGSPPSVCENVTPRQGQRNPPIKNPRVQNWLEGSGYITAWGELHRVEEALIMLSPLETVIADGYSDTQRLNGSNIATSGQLTTRLDKHLKILEARLRKEPIGELSSPPSAIEEVLARTELRYVRNAINEFRDDQRRGLIQARNRLLKTVGMTGFVGLLLVMLAVLMNVPPMNLFTASAFYLVGAIMGLFNQLYLDGSNKEATEDYGLATARLIHTPIISGLAALGGVLIIPMLSVSVAATNNVGDLSKLAGDLSKLRVGYLLDLTKQPFSVVLAAIFGLSPVVLLRRLQQEAEKYKTDLQGTESRTGPASVPPSPPPTTQPGSGRVPPSPPSTTYGSPP